jgi:hypothetical protein
VRRFVAAADESASLLQLVLVPDVIVFERLQLVLAGTESIVVLDAGVLQLADLVEFFEGDQLLREVLFVKFVEVFEAKHTVFLEFLFEDVSELVS